MRSSSPDAIAFLCGFVVFNAAMLMILLAIFRPRDGGYFAPWFSADGPVACFGASALFTLLGVADLPRIFEVVAWFALALGVFRLTVRQTLKLNFAQTLIYFALVFGYAAVAD